MDQETYARVALAVERRLGKGPVKVRRYDVDPWHLQISMPALSEALHPIGMSRDVDLIAALPETGDVMSDALRQEALDDLAAGDADRATEILLLLLEGDLREHDSRVAACRTLGLPKMGAPNHDMAHASVDRWVLEELGRRHGIGRPALADQLSRAIADDWRAFSIFNDAAGETRYHRFRTHFRPGHAHCAYVGIHIDVSDAIAFDGTHLRFRGTRPPDTALDLLVGRPVGELTDAAKGFGERPLLCWTATHDGFTAMVDAHPVRLGATPSGDDM